MNRLADMMTMPGLDRNFAAMAPQGMGQPQMPQFGVMPHNQLDVQPNLGQSPMHRQANPHMGIMPQQGIAQRPMMQQAGGLSSMMRTMYK